MEQIRYRHDLYKLLPNVAEAVCVELGCAECYNAGDMLAWGIKKLYLIDRWECVPSARGDSANDQKWHNANHDACIKRMEKFKGKYQVLRGPTTKMADRIATEELDLCYIDADHSYEGVKADIEAYWSKVKSGGIMAFHDFEAAQYGVKRAVTEHAMLYALQINLLPENKPEDAGAWVRKP